MRKLFFLIISLIGIWLLAYALIYSIAPAGLGLGALALLAGAAGFSKPDSSVCSVFGAIVGLAVIATPFLFVSFIPVNYIIMGALIFILAVIAGQIPTNVKSSITVDKDGNPMAEFKSLACNEDHVVLMKTELLGSMPSKIYLHPDQAWKLAGMIDFSLLCHIPGILYHGWKQYRHNKSQNKN